MYYTHEIPVLYSFTRVLSPTSYEIFGLAFQGAKVLNIIHDFNGFQNINWILPVKYGNIIVDYKVSNENIYFEIKTNKGEKCSQGEILFNDRSTDEFLNHLDDFSNNISTISYSGETLYSIFDRIGIRYGNFFKNLQKIYVINDQKCYGLLEVQNSIEELKTNLLDAAFQSTLGLSINNLQEPLLPFSAAKIFVSEKYINTLSGKFYVMVEKKSSLRSDISIFNSDKQMILTVKDLGVLPTININKKHNMVNFNEKNNNELYCQSTTFIPQWFESNDNNQKSNSSKFFVILYTIGSENSAKLLFDNLNTKYVCHLLELIDENSADEVKNIIGNNLQNTEIIVVDSTKYGINEIKSIYDKSYFFIEFLKKISRLSNVKIKVLTSQVVQYDEYNPNLQPQNSLIIGIAQTAAKEFTNLRIIPISVSQLNSQNSELLEVESNYQNPSYQPILYHKGKRYIRKLVPYKFEKLKESKFKYNGLYMIFGGLGGIGFELSKYLAQNYKANLVLVGRSDPDIAKIEKINRFGGTVSPDIA